MIATLENLDREALIAILAEPRNALVKQYQAMFSMDGVELEFEHEALEAIADLALLRETGARGLRSILEEVLQPIMFELPSRDDIERVVITHDVVNSNVAPTLVPKKARKRPSRKTA